MTKCMIVFNNMQCRTSLPQSAKEDITGICQQFGEFDFHNGGLFSDDLNWVSYNNVISTIDEIARVLKHSKKSMKGQILCYVLENDSIEPIKLVIRNGKCIEKAVYNILPVRQMSSKKNSLNNESSSHSSKRLRASDYILGKSKKSKKSKKKKYTVTKLGTAEYNDNPYLEEDPINLTTPKDVSNIIDGAENESESDVVMPWD